MTTGSRAAPFRIVLRRAGKDGLVLLDQIRSVDKTRLVKRLAALAAATLSVTLATLREVFDE